ncbi:hypothetical protein SBA3_2780019 [Candidatus Sulfopaludibacter sp. SbA3]|nr:hypothetical protein SBA3_2780019 [Candidatus Sulfopaludibacter sp. SbA3]
MSNLSGFDKALEGDPVCVLQWRQRFHFRLCVQRCRKDEHKTRPVERDSQLHASVLDQLELYALVGGDVNREKNTDGVQSYK